MPPRRSARLADALELRTSALAPLPLVLALRVFALLPVDSRARAACVARGWRAVLAAPGLWTRLDLSEGSGVALRLNASALLRGAAARAQGQLQHLDVSGPRSSSSYVVLEVVAANAGSLRELRVGVLSHEGFGGLNPAELVGAAPLLHVLEADRLTCTWEAAPRVLRGEPPWAPLRLRSLDVFFDGEEFVERVAAFTAALADVALQPALSSVSIHDADISRPEVLDALVDAALARRLNRLAFSGCTPPAPAPLARLLAGGSLSQLVVTSRFRAAPLFDAAGAALVAGALRATTVLTSLRLLDACLCRDMAASVALLGALVGHPSLRSLVLHGEQVADDDGVPLGAVLAALVAADAPALQHLNISFIALEDAGLAPIVDALPRNSNLRKLNLIQTDMSEQFARERLLPAVRANTSLRELQCGYRPHLPQGAAEAQELVKERLQRS
jgi:hypothetical protein